MSGEVNVLALVRGEEQYIFVFDPTRRTELLRLLGRYAADPELSFNWFDAAILSHKIRELMPAAVSTTEGNPGFSPLDSSKGEQTSNPPSSLSGGARPPRFQVPRS
ncbi:MAG: hypothetical protein KGQ51_12205 [Planctomycetes bacterium]|nr:hypothetical protein [Planctomycetota bacterium]